ncbi:Indole-3-glycerol phosphate synthase [Alkalibacterium sp. AK22]|uniref:indole-3-glycerol phosphate synthase TrpC n=1 Tax=Alkalibacterium sp. AK22 TaxID=1229520 RepID=UPI00044DC30F|nr:indole-3-glycerol phosphate synthase TrpC [Alkalibacterium sp. AK22]EXJ23945.1 Indole-3-glycerol phosphate synthase [Alkalibacterium sp. AK22]
METILDRIIEEKKKEVVFLKEHFSIEEIQRKQPVRSFYDRCQTEGGMQVIAEFKRSSPSKGEINTALQPDKQAKVYEQAGAGMISVLTDQPFFGGTIADLEAVREAVDLPVLNKDFVIDRIQIDRAYAYGADVILLIAAALSDSQLNDLYTYARSKELDVLVEVHNQAELKRVQQVGPRLIGINNRNLKTFEVDLATTEALADQIDTSKQVLISESGIVSAADVKQVSKAGAKAVLVGETLMRAEDPAGLIQTFKEGATQHAH